MFLKVEVPGHGSARFALYPFLVTAFALWEHVFSLRVSGDFYDGDNGVSLCDTHIPTKGTY